VLDEFDPASFDSDAEEVLTGNSNSSAPELPATRRDLEKRIAICDTLLDLRNYEQHLMMEYFSSLLCTTPTEEARHVEERHDKIVRVDLTSRTDYAGYDDDETRAVDEETVVIASQAPPLAGPRGRQPERPLIRRPHLDGGYNDPESEALIARARALLPPKEEKPEDPLDAVERRARLMCGKPEIDDAAAPEEIDEEFDPLLARAKALSLHASRVRGQSPRQTNEVTARWRGGGRDNHTHRLASAQVAAELERPDLDLPPLRFKEQFDSPFYDQIIDT